MEFTTRWLYKEINYSVTYEVQYTISGGYLRASRESPEEYPEIDIISTKVLSITNERGEVPEDETAIAEDFVDNFQDYPWSEILEIERGQGDDWAY